MLIFTGKMSDRNCELDLEDEPRSSVRICGSALKQKELKGIKRKENGRNEASE